MMDTQTVYRSTVSQIVGREREIRLIVAALGAGRDLLLEGPPGTSKSTILRTITIAERVPLYFVEGNADLTPAKLIGQHSPSRVLQEDYGPQSFTYGPLPLAMREGGFLYIEEFNRVPEDTLNTLLTAMAERELTIPRVGRVRAAPGFRVIAAMNPFDNIGTGRLSGAVADRLCRVRLDYQSEAEEQTIVRARTGSVDDWLVRFAVRAVRRTREHADVRMGASVRGAIDYVLIAEQLQALDGHALAPDDPATRELLVAAGQTALSIKIAPRESSRRTADDIIAEIVTALLDEPEHPDDGPGGGSQREPQEETQPGPQAAPEPGGAAPRAGRGGEAAPRSAAGAAGSSGRVYRGDDVVKASAKRPKGQRMLNAVLAEHPQLGEVLKQPDRQPAALEEALAGEDVETALAQLGALADLYDRADLRLLARRLARDLIVRVARQNVAERSGHGRLASAPYRGEATELDLDRSLETILTQPDFQDEDLFVLERHRHECSYALMLDISGSMKGAAIFNAALALASVAVRVGTDPLAVVAFWRDAAVLKRLNEPVGIDTLLDQVLSLTGHGLTDIYLGLRTGADELAEATTRERVGLLFSDGIQTTGLPAEMVAASFSTLHVISTGRTAESLDACRRLADLGHGRVAAIQRIRDIPVAVSHCLAA